MANTGKLIKDRIRIINEADRDLSGGIKAIEKSLYDTILELVEKNFTISGGRLSVEVPGLAYELGSHTYNTINIIANKIKADILASDYSENVRSYLTNFNRLKETTISLSSSLNQINVSRTALNSIELGAINKTTTSLVGTGLDTNLVEPVKNIIFNNVFSGSSIVDMELQLRQYIKGNTERLGQLERYVTQVARDGISQYDGLMQNYISDTFDLDCFGFEGSLITDSRAACVRLINDFNGVIKKSDLPEFINWAFNNSSGMIPGTNAENWSIYRNGYNCRHVATAIRCP